MRLLLSLANAVGAGRMRQATRELVKAYIHGLDSAALDDVFELLAWNQGIGYFRMKEIDPRDPLLHWDMFETMVKYYDPPKISKTYDYILELLVSILVRVFSISEQSDST